MQDYYCGEIDDEYDARYADRWLDALSLTKKEIWNHNIFQSQEELQLWLSVESDDDLTEDGDPVHEDPDEVEEKRAEWFDELRSRLFTYW